MEIFLTAVISMGILGAFFATILALASLKFSVEVDPRIQKIEELLPGANCGGCGLPGCSHFAEAIARGRGHITACPVVDTEIKNEISSIMGLEAAVSGVREVAHIFCSGGISSTTKSAYYGGIKSCRAANNIPGGNKDCQFGCLHFGDCAAVCPFDAITMGEDGMPSVQREKCTGCGRCENICPRSLITLVPIDQDAFVDCRATYPGKRVRDICQVGCIGCRLCVKVCPVKAIEFQHNLAHIQVDSCIQCGACAKKCPTHAISFSRPFIASIKISPDCVGCTLCLKKCPVGAIDGEPKELHHIDEERCIGCGLCFQVCRKGAIAVVYCEKNGHTSLHDAG